MPAAIPTAIVDVSGKMPEQFLAESDRAFAAGEYDDGSELLYQAAVCALTQLADSYSRPCGTLAELKAFARWLDEKHASDGCHARKLRTAETFHHNAQYHFMPPDEIDLGRPVVQDFVAALLSYHQKAARYE